MTTRLSYAAATAALALLLPGCSSSASSSFNSASAIATKIGCTGWTADSPPQMYVKEGGQCTIGSATVYVNLFADDAARNNWLKAAKAMGAAGSFAQGERWVIQSDDAATVAAASKAAGGSVAE